MWVADGPAITIRLQDDCATISSVSDAIQSTDNARTAAGIANVSAKHPARKCSIGAAMQARGALDTQQTGSTSPKPSKTP